MNRYWLLAFFVFCNFCLNAQTKTISDAQLFNAFHQVNVKFEAYRYMTPGGGNCASIALIKAAIGTFGLYGVFKSVEIDSVNRNVYVTLRNDKKIDLSFDRLEHGKNHFYVDKDIRNDDLNEIREYAKFCFAVMCRVKQINSKIKKYYVATDNINKGEITNNIYLLLGLDKKEIKDFNFANLTNFKNIVVYNSCHAVYSSQGNYDEAFNFPGANGTHIEKLEDLQKLHCKGSVCPIEGAYQLQ